MAKQFEWQNEDKDEVAEEERQIKETEEVTKTKVRTDTLTQQQEAIDKIKAEITRLQAAVPVMEAELTAIKAALGV